MDAIEAMKSELEHMREENKSMEAWLIAAESALEVKKRMVSEYKAIAKLADDLLDVIMEEGGHNVHENNVTDLDDETMKELVEEAMRDFTEALQEALSGGSHAAEGGNSGGYGGSSGDDQFKEAGGSDGGHSE